MIKVYDRTTKQYYPFEDYLAKFSDSKNYGRAVDVGSITNHSDGLAIYCPGHELFADQPVALSDTDNYDGTYSVVRRLSDDYVTINGTYIETEDSGYIYPYMNNSYHIAFLHAFEDLFDLVKQKTAYLGSKIKKDSGDNLMDDITVSEDEEDLVTGFMRTAFYNIQNLMAARSKTIINAYQFNVQLDQDNDGTAGDTYYLLWTVKTDEDDELRQHYRIIDELIPRVMESYIMKEWFQFIGQGNLYSQFERNYQQQIDKLRTAILASQGHKRVRFYERPTF